MTDPAPERFAAGSRLRWGVADTFEVGDAVHVALFGKGTVREARNGGRYLVEVKGASMVVAASALTAVPEGKRGKRAAAGRAAVPEPDRHAAVPSTVSAPSSLDLHGRTVAEAEALVDAFLNDAMLAGHATVRIIHGISGGRVRAAVHGRLRAYPTVRAFRVDPSNRGVTTVSL